MKNILIVSVNAVGDTYLSLSALDVLKKKLDKVRINFVINEPSEFLFEPLKDIKTYTLENKNLKNLFRLLLEIRKQKYDYTLNFFPGRLNTILNILSKSPIKAGYFNIIQIKDWHNISQKVKILGMNSTEKIWMPKMSYLKRVELVLNSVGMREEINSKFKFSNISFKKSDYIIIHPFSRYLDRALSIETIALLIYELKNKYHKRIVIIGNRNEFINKYMELQEKGIVELIYKDKIDDLIHIIINSYLFVGVDSFPLHIADSYNSNFVGIFGPTVPDSVLINKSKSIRINASSLFTLGHNKLVSLVMDKLNECEPETRF